MLAGVQHVLEIYHRALQSRARVGDAHDSAAAPLLGAHQIEKVQLRSASTRSTSSILATSSPPRVASRAFTKSGCSRMSRMSSMPWNISAIDCAQIFLSYVRHRAVGDLISNRKS